MPKDKINGNSSSKSTGTKFGRFVAKRKYTKRNDIDDPTSIPNNIDNILTTKSNDSADESSTDTIESGSNDESTDDVSGRSGSDGRDGRGRTGRGSDGDRSDSSDNPRKRGRRSRAEIIGEYQRTLDVSLEEATRIYEDQRAPRKVRNSEVIGDGIAGSLLLLTTVFETGTSMLAKVTQKDYLHVTKPECTKISSAIIDLIDSLPASRRKQFDKFMKYYVPYWKLGTALAEVIYPRYLMYQMEKEMINNGIITKTPKQTVNQTQASNDNSEPSETTIGDQGGFGDSD